jgi:uncharacterized protein
MYYRTISKQLDKWLDSHHSFTLYGARQTGKTTLVQEYAQKSGLKFKFVDCDKLQNRIRIEVEDDTKLKEFIGDSQLLILDEAQRVKNIGLNMKIIHDNIPGVKVIATGSSALDLASQIKEPMTGRDMSFYLHPLSLTELHQKYDKVDLSFRIDELLLYGSYPEVINLDSVEKKENQLYTLAENYLYKDLLELDLIKKTSVLHNLLRVLAFSIGSEVTNTSLAQKLGVRNETIERYLDLLEQCFIITRIRPYNRKIINEIKFPFKVYFWDLGIRNALLEDFSPISTRDDRTIGGLWENFVVIERIKFVQNSGKRAKFYFWRTNGSSSKEYDLIEEVNTIPTVFEIKWGESGVKKVKKYPLFFDNYPGSELYVISKNNFLDYLL